MRFISIDKPTAALGMLPPDVLLQIGEASIAKIEQLREERKILEFYHTPAGVSIIILDYDNVDEWIRDKMQIPITAYLEPQVYPLGDGMAYMKGITESMKAMGK